MQQAIDAVRGFNRFYTQLVGALDERFLGSDLSLAEARVLFELARGAKPVAADLQAALGMDAGYLSRVIRRFEARGWLVRQRGDADARRRPIDLTPAGRAVFEAIDATQRERVAAMLRPLDPVRRDDLVAALGTTRSILGDDTTAFTIRTFRTGDMGRIAARQSVLYRQSHGWDVEVVEGEVTTAFLRDFKPGREQCWVADVDGVMAGSIFLTDESATEPGLCRLRLFYVEPFARGRGIGGALVEACVGFARDAGYAAVTLWTHTILTSARRIYAAHGFTIVETSMHEEFGTPVQGETWRLSFDGETAPIEAGTAIKACPGPASPL